MYELFKKRQPPLPPLLSPSLPAGEPHPQHRNFSRISIPDALTRHRSSFLFAVTTPQASQMLQENWNKVGIAMLPQEQLLPPAGLGVSSFRHDKYVCFLILFPAPKAPGESYFGLIVAGPTEDWSPEMRAKVPVRYFILERSTSDISVIFEWRPSDSKGEELFESLGSGTSPQDPRDFVGKILTEFYGLKPD